MIHFFVKKSTILFISLFVVATLTFFLMHMIPGDPFTNDQAIPEEVLKSIHKYYGLDQPLIVQYAKYLERIVHFDLGPSLKYQGRTVNEIIAEGFPVSFALGIESLIISLIGGIALGAIAAIYHQRWQDHVALFIAILGISVPSFLFGTLLQYLFAMKWDIFPIARWDSFSYTIMPAITLAAVPLAVIARLTRANLIEVLQQDYILTARLKGLNTFQIIVRHAIRNALLPVITYIGPLTAAVFTGSFVIEKIFGIPGLGQWVIVSISNRDYPMIMGMTIFYSAILLLCVFIVDLIYCLIDPRIKLNPASNG